MSIQATPLPSFMIPENAPFSPEQRVWLSGFLAAAIAPHAVGVTALSGSEAAALIPGVGAPAGPALASNDEAPWHDPAMARGRAHDARRGQAARPAPHGRDGAAGLRPVRLQLRRLRQRDRPEER